MAAWNPGEVILGDYLIEKELGRGGMGRVWLVKSNSTGRQFAVKQALLKEEKHRKAFLAELQTWIDLPEHPNIVPCRFFRTVGDEIVIFADYIEGGSLADWISQRKLTTLEQILDVAIQFAWGLHAIHERGLIHQDVKPGNVLMTSDGVPMVTDFGLARARSRAEDEGFISPTLPPGQHSVLFPGAGVMTPQYASPEQRAGQPLSRKTDIWSWGVSVLDIFMGCVSCPHGGQVAAEVLQSFIENGQMEDGLPDLPAELAKVLECCFVRDPARRWANLDLVAQALIQINEHLTGRKYARPPPQVAGPVVLGVRHDRRLKGATWRNPRDWLREAYIAAGRNPKEVDNFQPAVVGNRKAASISELATCEEAQRIFEQTILNNHPENMERLASLLFDKALIHKTADDIPGAIQSFNGCIAIYERLVEQEGRRDLANELAGIYMNKAIAVKALGDLRGAVALYDRCITIRECIEEKEEQRDISDDLALACMNKAVTLKALGDLCGAVALYDRCIAILERLVERKGRRELANNLAGAYLNKANAMHARGDLCGAVEMYDHCILIRERLIEQEGQHELNNALAGTCMNKAVTLKALGNMHGAVALYDRSIAIYERLVEREGRSELASDLAVACMNKATAVKALGDLRGAVALYDRSIAIYERLVELEGRSELADDLAGTYMNKANTVEALGDLRGAVALHDRCIAIYKRLVERGGGRPELACGLARAYMSKANNVARAFGDMRRAVDLYDHCIAIYERLVEREDRSDLAGTLAWAKLNRAWLLNRHGDLSVIEVAIAKKAFAQLREEVKRTGRSDLQGVLQWAQKSLAGKL